MCSSRGLSDWLLPLLIGMALTALVRFILLELQERILLRARMAMSLNTGGALMRKLLTLPVAFFDQRFAGEIADRVKLNESLATLLTGHLAQAAVNLVSALFFLIVLLFYHWALTLTIAALALLNAAVLLLSNRLLSDRYRKISIDRGKLAGARVAGLKDMETFKASGGEDMLFARWTGLTIAVQNGEQQVARLAAFVQPMPALISALIIATILVWGGFCRDGRDDDAGRTRRLSDAGGKLCRAGRGAGGFRGRTAPDPLLHRAARRCAGRGE